MLHNINNPKGLVANCAKLVQLYQKTKIKLIFREKYVLLSIIENGQIVCENHLNNLPLK